MKVLFLLICVTLLVFLPTVESRRSKAIAKLKAAIDRLSAKIAKGAESTRKIVSALARQMMLQQLFVEERIRSEGYSGVKQIRLSREGTRNYYGQSHTSSESVLAIHDHSNNGRLVGMGEFVGVLNGVEFRTRHNDYRLYMPHRTRKKLHATENIPFPDVPPEVTSKRNISEQVKEMREWFKAWKYQNHTVRDYRKYFKPVLCYLEGAWTKAESKIDEPFESDRHFVDASSWFDLQEKVRFTSYTGRKDNLENFSFLPTTIMNVTEDGIPQFAQWNYRILCHPLSRDLPLNRLRVVDEVGSRLSAKRTYEEHSKSRSARFQVNPFDEDTWSDKENRNHYGLLDELMGEIPGKDNYQGNLTDEAFDLPALSLAPGKQGPKLRADRYHRWFKATKADAMGVSTRHRGFSDENLFMAMTTQPRIPGMDLTRCKRRKCKTLNQKWSYAIPLEIIYLTPLSKWNPYNIEYKGSGSSTEGKTVTAGGRNGANKLNKAYNGTNHRLFYQTPVEFFSGNEVGSGAADTTRNSVGVLDKKGNLRLCKATGPRIILPFIDGVGSMRQRYPIMPVYGEGSAVWKELEAMKDVILESQSNGYILREPLTADGQIPKPPRKDIKFQVKRSLKTPPRGHHHEITLAADQVDFVKDGGTQVVTTTTVAGHEHTLWVKAYQKNDTKEWVFYIKKCDASDRERKMCWNQHPRVLVQMPDQ